MQSWEVLGFLLSIGYLGIVFLYFLLSKKVKELHEHLNDHESWHSSLKEDPHE